MDASSLRIICRPVLRSTIRVLCLRVTQERSTGSKTPRIRSRLNSGTIASAPRSSATAAIPRCSRSPMSCARCRPDKYVLPQAYVEDMYRPDRFGRTGTGTLDVTAARMIRRLLQATGAGATLALAGGALWLYSLGPLPRLDGGRFFHRDRRSRRPSAAALFRRGRTLAPQGLSRGCRSAFCDNADRVRG